MTAEEIFLNKKYKEKELAEYGFVKNGNAFVFNCPLLGGEMSLFVSVSLDGNVSTRVIDNKTGENYVLYLLPDANGEYVGKVRQEVEKTLLDIREKCFDGGGFGKQSQEIISYIDEKYGDKLEFLWKKFPNDAIWRRKDNRKWYGLIVKLSKQKLGLASQEQVEIMDVRANEQTLELIDGEKYFPAYHMNKKHWITFMLDFSLSTKEICALIDKSYSLADKK